MVTGTQHRSQLQPSPAFRNNQLFTAIVPQELQTSNTTDRVSVTSPERQQDAGQTNQRTETSKQAEGSWMRH